MVKTCVGEHDIKHRRDKLVCWAQENSLVHSLPGKLCMESRQVRFYQVMWLPPGLRPPGKNSC